MSANQELMDAVQSLFPSVTNPQKGCLAAPMEVGVAITVPVKGTSPQALTPQAAREALKPRRLKPGRARGKRLVSAPPAGTSEKDRLRDKWKTMEGSKYREEPQ